MLYHLDFLEIDNKDSNKHPEAIMKFVEEIAKVCEHFKRKGPLIVKFNQKLNREEYQRLTKFEPHVQVICDLDWMGIEYLMQLK
ncbi:hypothetical protein FGO68_gene14998 [Halteria grandinella]|uniref:Uncharacterized protein n=1 Tax=Halteria grandinella TaxID=5974 RepID=A0A8J8NB74_HALGN|nr:hypothetical protein FGO68_gene14998 [Halteria grandinella]